MSNFFEGALYSFGFLCLLLLIEYFTRLKKFPKEITRRVAHMASGLFGAVMGMILEPWVFITFVLFFLLIICVSYARKFFSSIHGVKRKTYGELLLPLGILAAYLIAGQNTTYTVSVLILAISDPLAGLFGDLKLNEKIVVGSIVFLLVTLIILLVSFKAQRLPVLFVIAAIITLVERFSNYGSDNLSIPLSASLLLKLLL